MASNKVSDKSMKENFSNESEQMLSLLTCNTVCPCTADIKPSDLMDTGDDRESPVKSKSILSLSPAKRGGSGGGSGSGSDVDGKNHPPGKNKKMLGGKSSLVVPVMDPSSHILGRRSRVKLLKPTKRQHNL